MSTLVDRLLAKKGKSRSDFSSTSKVGKAFRKTGIQSSAEFKRIDGLPRRDWRNEENDYLVESLTERFARPGSTQKLLPVQAALLADAHDYGGAFAPIGVGSGKTLPSYLLGAVMDAERPLIMVPARLVDKTKREWWEYSENWVLPKVHVVSYEKLGVDKNKNWLDNLSPDTIFFDECHKLKNTKAGVTKRVARYLRKNRQQITIVLASGTITVRSLKDYWHLLKWCLGDELMPLPSEWPEMMEWAECLDVQSDRAIRTAPGVLANWSDKPFPSLDEVREGYQRRLTETPGVVATNTNEVDASLFVDYMEADLSHMYDYYHNLRKDWETPDGHPFEQASDMWRHARELVCGFYYVWDPRPPTDWLVARKAWSQFVRGVLGHSRTYDTPFQVAKACSSGHLQSIEYQDWIEVRDTYEPNVVPVWVDDTVLNLAADWLSKEKQIVWTEHPPFARRLSELTGVKYFGHGAKSKDGTFMPDYSGPAIASSLTVGEGFNLQKAWYKSLVVSCLPNGKTAEQLLGRTHRRGQPQDEVHYRFISACYEQAVGILQMVKDARYMQSTIGQPQRMVYADKQLFTIDDLMAKRGPIWHKG